MALRSRKRSAQQWKAGDLFVVPLLDGSWGLGQVSTAEVKALNSVVCSFFGTRGRVLDAVSGSPNSAELIAVLFVTRDLLDSGDWKVIGNHPIVSIGKYLDVERLRSNGFVGVDVIGSANVETLMNAVSIVWRRGTASMRLTTWIGSLCRGTGSQKCS